MGEPTLEKPGRTLAADAGKGSAGLRRIAGGYTVRRAATLAVAITAFAVGIAATGAALKGVADPGVEGAVAGQRLTSVHPVGFAWRDGIRPGQLVLELSAADDAEGWSLTTINDAGVMVTSRATYAGAAVRDSLPLAVLALLAGAVAVVSFRTNRDLTAPSAWLAFAAGTAPLVAEGSPGFSTVALAAAAALPGLWILGRVDARALKSIVALALVGGIAIWTIARFEGWAAYERLDSYRSSFAIVGGAAFLADRALARRRRSSGGLRLTRPDSAELLSVAMLAAIAVALVTIFQAPPLVVAILVVAGAVALPSVRNRARPVEDALLADIRAQAAADGAEAERARLARELHDVPLHEVIAAIRHLEVVPGTEAVSDDLRALAGHLRDVAIDLRPPVLDDLGLPAALYELAEGSSRTGPAVTASLQDETSFDPAHRPPAEVELAMFRIASEAVSNSVRHAGATTISIHGRISPVQVELVIADNGRGLPSRSAAGSGKHIGMSAMRRRAQAVDADLSIKSSNSGTEVHVEWRS